MTEARLREIFRNAGYTVLDVFPIIEGKEGYVGHLRKDMNEYHYFINSHVCIMQMLYTVCDNKLIIVNNVSHETFK